MYSSGNLEGLLFDNLIVRDMENVWRKFDERILKIHEVTVTRSGFLRGVFEGRF